MNVPTAIQNRRAVKRFDPTHKITKKEREKLLSLGLLSPTAFNIQNWRFVVVDDPQLRKQIRDVSWGQPQVTDASILIILCANLRAWEQEPLHWHSACEPNREFMVPSVRQFYEDFDHIQRDEAMRSCGIAAQTLMLAAQSMGYDSCPMDGFDFEAVAELINLPEDHTVCMFVAIGKGLESSPPRQDKLPLEEVLVMDHF